MSVRDATVQDLDSLAKVNVASWHAVYDSMMTPEISSQYTEEGRKKWFEGILSSPRYLLAVHEEETGANGFIACALPGFDDSGDGEIAAIYIAPAAQNKGIGRALLTWGTEHIAARGASRIVTWVHEKNRGAQAFLKACGFSPDGTSRSLPQAAGEAQALRFVRTPGS